MVRLGKQIERSFSPHVTLAYGQGELAWPLSITPVDWPVSRVVLLRSEVGSNQHEELGSWTLPG
jgi:2'-5' RNA ligase